MLGELGFMRCATEHEEELIVGVYVDDLIITGARAEDIDRFKHEMTARFRMSDLGALSYYLGIEVRQGKEELSSGRARTPPNCWKGAAWWSASHA